MGMSGYEFSIYSAVGSRRFATESCAFCNGGRDVQAGSALAWTRRMNLGANMTTLSRWQPASFPLNARRNGHLNYASSARIFKEQQAQYSATLAPFKENDAIL